MFLYLPTILGLSILIDGHIQMKDTEIQQNF